MRDCQGRGTGRAGKVGSVTTTSRYDANELKARVDLRTIARQFLGTPKRSSQGKGRDQYFAPWRNDGSKPSLYVTADYFKDFGGNGEKGDLYSFIMLMEKTDFRGALEWVQRYLGENPPQVQRRDPDRNGSNTTLTHEPPGAIWQNAARAFLQECSSYLHRPSGAERRDYLRGRGLSDDAIKRWKIGYNPKWEQVKGIGWVAPGIVIPIYCDGALWALRVRTFDPKLDKYSSAEGSKLSGSLFNADSLKANKPVLFVEGEFDAILAQELLGDSIAVVTLGSATNFIQMQRVEQLRDVSQVYLALDNDSAGQEAGQALIDTLTSYGHQPILLTIPKGKDVTDYVTLHKGDLKAWAAKAEAKVLAAEEKEHETRAAAKRAAIQTEKRIEAKNNPEIFPCGLPDTWRTLLANSAYFPRTLVVVLELIIRALNTGKLDPEAFSAKQVVDIAPIVGFKLPESTILAMLEKLSASLIFQKLPLKDCNSLTKGSFQKMSEERAPEFVFRLLSREQIKLNIYQWVKPRLVEESQPYEGSNPVLTKLDHEFLEEARESDVLLLDAVEHDRVGQELEASTHRVYKAGQGSEKRFLTQKQLKSLDETLDDLLSTPLAEDIVITDGFDYRAAWWRGYVNKNPGVQMSRAEIGAMVGLSEKSAGELSKHAKLKAEPQEWDKEITHVRDLRLFGSQLHAKAIRVYPQLLGRDLDDYEPDEEQIKADLAAGKKLKVRYRAANKYTVSTEKPTAREKVTRKSAPRETVEEVESVPMGQEAEQETSPQGEETAPRIAHYGPTHDPEWIRGQLRLALKLNGWKSIRYGYLVNPDTGEQVSVNATARELIEAIIGHKIARSGESEAAS